MRRLLAAITLSLCAWAALAGPFEDGLDAAQRGDYAAALRLLQPLADQGYAGAQGALGVMYDNGRGVPQDYAEAHKWFNLSAARAMEKENRDTATKNRDIVAAKMTPAQVAEAQKLAREWKPAAPP